MGIDLLIAITAISSLSLAAFLLGAKFSIQTPSRSGWLFAGSLLFALTFAWFNVGNLSWAALFPDSAVLYWSNAMPIMLGFCAGLATRAPGLGRWHRPITVCVLSCLGLGYILSPIIRPIVAPAELLANGEWSEDVCLQSHPASCGAAAAATLLQLDGVKTNEREMAAVCLTSAQGTMPLGLYRGVSLVAARHGRSAEVASSEPSDWLSLHQLPNVAMIQFEPEFDSENETGSLTRLLGPRGEGHAIVIIGKTDAGRWIIGDPAVGRICWTDEELRSRFTGEAIYLARDLR